MDSDRTEGTPLLTMAPAEVIGVKGWGAAPTGQREQSDLGGWHTLRLGPGSAVEKQQKKWQHSQLCQHLTNDSIDKESAPIPSPNCPPPPATMTL